MALPLSAHTTLDASDSLGFFTTVADKMLRSTFPFGITNIPVYADGVYVYTPAIQRLLQLSANILDAANTNTFPSVFRPLFGKGASGNVLITGYSQVTNISGTSDPQLSQPYDVAALANYSGPTPIADASGPVNVYGVPWIIGAKKGLPNFNQLSLVTAATFTRKLMVSRNSTDPTTAIYATNQMYVLGISNTLGISFWNSYSNAYPRPVTVCAVDTLCVSLTNGVRTWFGVTNFTFSSAVNPWPGSQWSGTPPNSTPSPSSFVNANWTSTFLPPSVYRFGMASFDPVGSPTSSGFETTSPPLPQLPLFGLNVTNYLQAFILDGTNVIDYVQLNRPIGSGTLNLTLADPDYPNTNAPGVFYQWSTNAYPTQNDVPYGAMNQLWVSGHPSSAPIGGQWSTAPTPMGITTPTAEAAFFNGFFVPAFQYNGQTYVNNQISIQAPYTPTRTVFAATLLQANDPIVHYLASDLNGRSGALNVWANRYAQWNGAWSHIDDLLSQSFPTKPATPVGGRYQPWLRRGQMDGLANVIPVTNNYAAKDPLVYGSDNWNFPTNLLSSLSGLGQVHRGTPWQTFYLKDVDFLGAYLVSGGNYVGTNTWMQWTGDLDANDAPLTAPLKDRTLAGLLMSLLNTNDPARLFPINDPNPADWAGLLDGLVVYSNSAPSVFPTTPVTFDTYVASSNSPQAAVVASGILQARASRNGQNFYSIADICATPELSRNSPFLNLGSTSVGKQQMNYGITDWEYEAIPAQLLPLLRPDSIGSLALTNGGMAISFSGADGYDYALQASTDLVNWQTVSTNSPMQGTFTWPLPTANNSSGLFYRTVLLP